jgi:hypothetical protein
MALVCAVEDAAKAWRTEGQNSFPRQGKKALTHRDGVSSRKEECRELLVRQVASNGEHSDELTVSIDQSRSVRGVCLHQRHPTRSRDERSEVS